MRLALAVALGLGLLAATPARAQDTFEVVGKVLDADLLARLCGAELREVPAVPYKDPNNYVHIAARTAKEYWIAYAGAPWTSRPWRFDMCPPCRQ